MKGDIDTGGHHTVGQRQARQCIASVRLEAFEACRPDRRPSPLPMRDPVDAPSSLISHAGRRRTHCARPAPVMSRRCRASEPTGRPGLPTRGRPWPGTSASAPGQALVRSLLSASAAVCDAILQLGDDANTA
jgi:hypothetical protein